jgi:hypothetical protein
MTDPPTDDCYPLECAWDLYAHPMSDPHTYRTAYMHLARVATCKQWGELWATLPGADVFVAHEVRIRKTRVVSFSFFRQGAKPEWEDPANHGGTTLTVRAHLSPSKVRETWTTLCADCARGAADDVVGVQVTQKWAGALKFDVWLRAHCDVAHATHTVNAATGLTFYVAPRDSPREREEATPQQASQEATPRAREETLQEAAPRSRRPPRPLPRPPRPRP